MSAPSPTAQIITRLDMLVRGAAVLMLAFLTTGTVIMLSRDRAAWVIGGLQVFAMGITMIIAVGAAANHKAILEQQDRIEDKLDRLAELDCRLLSTTYDELAKHRNGHQS